MNKFQYAVKCLPRLYANDTCLWIQNSNLEDLQNAVDAENDEFQIEWFKASLQ